jgi:hypothetical protein
MYLIKIHTLKSLIGEHARLDSLAIFHVINEKFHPARLLVYLVNNQEECLFFPTLLGYSGL